MEDLTDLLTALASKIEDKRCDVADEIDGVADALNEALEAAQDEDAASADERLEALVEAAGDAVDALQALVATLGKTTERRTPSQILAAKAEEAFESARRGGGDHAAHQWAVGYSLSDVAEEVALLEQTHEQDGFARGVADSGRVVEAEAARLARKLTGEDPEMAAAVGALAVTESLVRALLKPAARGGESAHRPAPEGVQTCRVCGCRSEEDCWNDERGACWWVHSDLCSHCIDTTAKGGA
jgi:hypothetical protein